MPVQVIDPQHTYQIGGGQQLQFVKKEKQGEQLVTIHEGTTNEELLEVLLDRTKGFQQTFPCEENMVAIAAMEEALSAFNERTQKRQQQGVEATPQKHVS